MPHPGSDDWGEGQILVTTRYTNDDIRSILYCNKCALHYVMPPMSEANAVSLLHKVSGYEGEGAEEVVNSHHVGTLPLNVARWANNFSEEAKHTADLLLCHGTQAMHVALAQVLSVRAATCTALHTQL